jgi:AcrR family transcriptional regulator
MFRGDTVSVQVPVLNRAQRHKLQTRERLMAATATLMTTMGYAALTVRRITDEADLGHGTFYLHFTNLDDAVWAVLEQQAESINRVLVARLAQEPVRRRAYLGWVQIFQAVLAMPDLFLEIFGRQGSAQVIQAYQDWLAKTHEMNMTAGAFEPHDRLPLVFQSHIWRGRHCESCAGGRKAATRSHRKRWRGCCI